MSHAARLDRLGSWSVVDAETLWPAEDGDVTRFINGALYRIAGWDGLSHSHVFKSTDRGETWTQLSDAPFSDRHAMPGPKVTINGVDWVYIVGGDGLDGNYPTGPGDVWRFNGTVWELVSSSMPGVLGHTLHMAEFLDTDLYTFGGQTDPSDASTAVSTVYRHSNYGFGTSTQLADAPFHPKGIAGVCKAFGKIVVIGGGTNDSEAASESYYNEIHTFDGSVWTEVLADNHSRFTKAKYTSAFVFHGCVWFADGLTTNRTNLQQLVCSKDLSKWLSCTSFEIWSARHAGSYEPLSDCVIHLGGKAGNDADTKVHRWDLI
jgi:hypothetical protein